MSIKPVAIVLGGTHPHITLIESLKRRGYHTVLVDFAQNPIAKKFADEHILESSMDKEKVCEIAGNYQAKLVITTCSDQANVTACYVGEKLGLPIPYSYKTSLNVTDKELMKSIMLNNDIPTAKYIIVGHDFCEQELSNLQFPLIVKPADCYGSKGVRVANTKQQLYKNIGTALKLSRVKKAIVEEYIVGEEIGIDCFVKNMKAEVIITKSRNKIQNSLSVTQQITGCIWPVITNEQMNEKFRLLACDIAKAFRLDNTPLMIQAVVSGNDVYVIEFGARIGGGNSHSIIKLGTGFDIIEAAIDSFLGCNVELNFRQMTEIYADVFLYTSSSEFGYIANTESLIKNGIVESIVCTKQFGMHIGKDLVSSNRVGAFIIKSNDRNELLKKIKTALDTIEVYDIKDRPIMRRDVYN